MAQEDERLERLVRALKDMGSIVVAFSGGVDSSFLLKVAHDVLGNNVIAVTSISSSMAGAERDWALKVARLIGVEPIIVHSEEMRDPQFFHNPPDRCYYCKKALFVEIGRVAKEHGIHTITVGENADDLHADRPGRRAAEEYGVRSPLAEAGLTKNDIRTLSKRMGLATFDKPQMACLASRIPFGERISEEKLKQIEDAENYLRSLGPKQLRVRHHGDLARIEVGPEDIDVIVKNRSDIVEVFKRIGFVYVTLDIQGFRSGSMNEAIDRHERH